jgi:hypothetical protein
MPTFEIKFHVPEGTRIEFSGLEAADRASGAPQQDAVEHYWRRYLSANSRKLFAAAAAIELTKGPGFLLEEVASRATSSYVTVQSWHRTSGRTARKWRSEMGMKEPIRLDAIDFPEDPAITPRRTRYAMPAGVAKMVRELPHFIPKEHPFLDE